MAAAAASPADEGKAPHLSAGVQPDGHPEREPAAKTAEKPARTPPRQRPAVNASIGEGSDALDAPQLRSTEPAKSGATTRPRQAPTSASSSSRQAVLQAALTAPPIPHREPTAAPPLTSEIVESDADGPESEAERGQRSAENGGPAPLWLEGLANQLGVRARFIPLHRPSNTVSRYVDPCDKRDYRCQEFHDNFFREDVPTSPLGMTNSIGAGVAGGIVRAAAADREIEAPLMWTVKPRFVGLEASF